MPRKSNKRKNNKRTNKKNTRKTNKKTLTKQQYKAVKKIAYSVSNNYRNKEYNQLTTSFYITNCGTLYHPAGDAALNTYEFHRGNFEFFPLTNLGALETNMSSIPSTDFINLKNTHFLLRWVNNGASEKKSDRVGYFSGLRFSIHSIQIKGVIECNNTKGYAKPGKVGFRVVRQKYNPDKSVLTTYADALDKNMIPQIGNVYKGMDAYVLDSQDKIDKLHYAYLKDPKFNKEYPTVIRKYMYFKDTDLTVEHCRKTFNVFRRFRYPLQVIYPQGSSVTDATVNAYAMSLRNNLYFCPYFSQYDDDSEPGTNIIYEGTQYPFSIDGTYKLYGQIIINYTDS